MTVTLPSIVGVVTIEKTEAGHVISVSITPGQSNRTWTCGCKYASMPAPDILENAAKRCLVAAVQKWLSEAAEVHPAIGVEGQWNETTTSPSSSTHSSETSPPSDGSAA